MRPMCNHSLSDRVLRNIKLQNQRAYHSMFHNCSCLDLKMYLNLHSKIPSTKKPIYYILVISNKVPKNLNIYLSFAITVKKTQTKDHNLWNPERQDIKSIIHSLSKILFKYNNTVELALRWHKSNVIPLHKQPWPM
jgi:uncharacterized protein (UPF0332 family)